MPRYNPYEKSPTFETEHFALRLVKIGDAASLLKCYSDPSAARFFNADSCTSDFKFKTVEEMTKCIASWLDCYKQKSFIRLTILLKSSQEPIGTVEVFGGGYNDEPINVDGDKDSLYGLLRIDIRSDFESSADLDELLDLAVSKFYDDFDFDAMLMKAVPAADERIAALHRFGFERTDAFRPGLNYYIRKKKPVLKPGIAYCGLACCLCGENAHCPGCRSGGCKDKDWCVNLKCCIEKGLNGCWECEDFPCSGSMLDKVRIRAFARFVKQYGEDKLVACLMKNRDNGMVYHYEGQYVGDYDHCQSEGEVIEMILRGQ